MITAIPYAGAFAAIAGGLLYAGYRREAEGVATMAAGMLAMIPFVALSPLYPFAGMIIWRVVAMRIDRIDEADEFPRCLHLVGYAVGPLYVLYFLDIAVTMPEFVPRFWPTWVLNGACIVMVALMLRRPTNDFLSFINSRRDARLAKGLLRPMGGVRSVGRLSPSDVRMAQTKAEI